MGEYYDGLLTCDKTNGIIKVEICYIDNTILTWDGREFRFSEMTGTINDNLECILYDCEVINLLCENGVKHFVTIKAKTIFFDVPMKTKNELEFNTFDFKLSNILKWSDLAGLDINRCSNLYDIAFVYKKKDEIAIDIDDNTKVEFIPVLGEFPVDFEVEEFKINQYINVRISKKRKEFFESFFDDINKVVQLIMISSGYDISITDISCYDNDVVHKLAEREYITEFEVIDHRMSSSKFIKEKLYNRFLFKLSELVDYNCLKSWFSLYDEYQSIYNLYLLSIKTYVTPEIKFCNYIQVIEIFHRKRYKVMKKFKKHLKNKFVKRNELLSEILDHPDQKDNKFITNRSRMLDIFTDSNNLLNSEIVVNNVVTFSEIFTDTRNYYTHYDSVKKCKALHGKKLLFAIDILDYIICFSIMSELGFPVKFINNRLNDKESIILYSKYFENIISK